jgi:hypothetical protein
VLYQDQSLFEREVCYIPVNSDQWYYEMKYYLTHGTTPHYMEQKKKRALRLKSSQYHLIQGILCRRNYDGVFLRCLEKEDVDKVLSELHDGPVGGHFGGDTTTHKILRDGYYWPTLFKYSHAYARKCQECQRATGKEKKHVFPLQPVIIESLSNNGVWM